MFLGLTSYLAKLSFVKKLGIVVFLLLIVWWRSYYIFEFPILTGEYCVGTALYHFKDKNRKAIYSKNKHDHRELNVQFWYPTQKRKPGQKNLSPYLSDIIPFIKDTLKENYLYYFPNFVCNFLLNGIYTHAIPNALVSHDKQKYPLIIFSHGFGGLSNFYTTQVEELASHGYIVAGINHTHYCSVAIFPDGRTFPLAKKWGDHFVGYLSNSINNWVKDVRFVLNKLKKLNKKDPDKRFTKKLDLSNIGIFGHSMGGATATQACRLDKRIKAGINMDGPLFGKKATKGFNKPFMFMLAQEPLQKLKQPMSDAELKRLWMTREDEKLMQKIYADGIPALCSNIRKDSYYIVVKGTQHHSFSDIPLVSKISLFFRYINFQAGSIPPYRIINITNKYILGFFNKYLKGEKSILLEDENQDYPEVVMRKWNKPI